MSVLKCPYCEKPLDKGKNDNAKASKNATYEGSCKNDKCIKYGFMFFEGILRGDPKLKPKKK